MPKWGYSESGGKGTTIDSRGSSINAIGGLQSEQEDTGAKKPGEPGQQTLTPVGWWRRTMKSI